MTFEPPFDRITAEAGKLSGKPCIRGIRIAVVHVVDMLATYPDRARLFENYPCLEEEDIVQVLHFASTALADMRMPTQSVDEDNWPAITFTPTNVETFHASRLP